MTDKESGGSNCGNTPAITTHANGKDVVFQPVDSIPFVCHNADMVRNKEVLENLLRHTGMRIFGASLVEPVQHNQDTIIKTTGKARVEEYVRQQNAGVKTHDLAMQDFSEEFPGKVFGSVQGHGGSLGEVSRDVSCVPVSGAKNQVDLSGKTDLFQLWHVVHPDFVDLLELIGKHYPDTFNYFTPQREMISTLSLNTLCTAVNSFSNVSTAEVTAETISQYKDLFAVLEKWGFNVKWLVDLLNFIEQVRFSRPLLDELHVIDCQLDRNQREFQELQALRNAKMAEIKEAFGHLGNKLAAGCLGDSIFVNH